MRRRLVRVVPVMEDQVAVRNEEEQEAGTDEGHDAMLVSDGFESLGQEVEQRDGDDDPARQRDCRLELAVEPERERAAGEGGDDRQSGEWDCDPGHPQLAQVP